MLLTVTVELDDDGGVAVDRKSRVGDCWLNEKCRGVERVDLVANGEEYVVVLEWEGLAERHDKDLKFTLLLLF